MIDVVVWLWSITMHENKILSVQTIKLADVDSNNAFNFIRLVCCLIVIYEHIIVLTGIPFINLNLRGSAVNIFFILSGFWVTKSYVKSTSLKDFFIKRCKKIMPLYYGVIFLMAIGFCFLSVLSFSEYFTDLKLYKYLFANTIFLNFLVPALPGVFNGSPVNGSLWTLKLEVGFYICLPFIMYICAKLNLKKRNVFLGLIYFCSYLYFIVVSYLAHKKYLPQQFVHQLPAYMMYFVVGIFYMLNWTLLQKHKIKIFVLSLVTLLVSAVSSIYLSIYLSILIPLGITGVIMFLAVSLRFCNSIASKTDYSYSMYLFHYPIIMIMNSIGYFQNKPLVAVLSVFACTFTLAFMVHATRVFVTSLLRGDK